MSGSIIRFPHTTSWRADGKIYNTQNATNTYCTFPLVEYETTVPEANIQKGIVHQSQAQNGLLLSAGVCTTLCLYTVLHLNPHDARSLSAECESSIPEKCALVTGTMYMVNFSGAFAKLRKVTISFVMSVRLPSVRPSVRSSVRMEQFGSQWADFNEI